MTRPRFRLLAAALLLLGGVVVAAPAQATPYRQVEVPVDGIDDPVAVAVGADGAVYVAGSDRVVQIVDGAATVLPFDTHEMRVQTVTVDSRGTVYITGLTSRPQCQANPLAQKLTAGSTEPIALSVDYVSGAAVDTADNLYLAYGDRVHRIAPGSAGAGEDIAVDGDQPFLDGVGVDGAGVVYVADSGLRVGDELKRPARVLQLANGSDPQRVLHFPGLGSSVALAVDAVGNIYVADTDHDRVLKRAAGQSDLIELPFSGLDRPRAVAVGPDGSVYVVDAHRVVALTAV